MNDYSDEELLFMTSLQNENEQEARKAFTLFYYRYNQFLYNLCCYVCRDTNLADDVMQNTWIAVYKYSHSYDAKESSVKTWLSIIAKNKMLDLLKGQNDFLSLNEDIYSIADVDNEEESSILTPEKEKLDKALNTLSERDKDILLTYMRYSDGSKHLPDEEINELCQRYGTTSENLRQIKKRTLDKVKNLILIK